MRAIKRREFIAGSVGAVATAPAFARKVASANDKIIVAIMGIGGRGTSGSPADPMSESPIYATSIPRGSIARLKSYDPRPHSRLSRSRTSGEF